MFAAHPAPPLSVVLATLALALVLVLGRPCWPRTRHVVTIAHEAAHGVVAVLAGRRLSGIRLHSDTSGVTVSRGRRRGPGMIATLLAGYPGPALIGLGAAAVLASGRPLAVLWGALVVLALVLLQIRNLFGLWSVLATAAVVLAASKWLPVTGQAAAAYLLTWFLLLAAPRAVLELPRHRRHRRSRESDADQLAALTGVPALVWITVFGVVTVGALVLGARWLLP